MDIEQWKAKVNGVYKGTIVSTGASFSSIKMPRFSTGSIDLDMALGGGWPFSRVVVVAGEYSTGKTVIALKAAAEIENFDHVTKKHKDTLPADAKFIKGRALFVDVEGTLDLAWAKLLGFDDEWHFVCRPDTAEQAIDVVTSAIRDDLFDLIIIDSLAALTPSKEIEESSEDWQMGLAARLINKAMRIWNASLVKLSQTGIAGGPLLMCLNQVRLKIGVVMGDPRTLPGGKGQTFCSSIIIYTKSPEYIDVKEEELAEATLKGVIHKNKTYVPRVNYGFMLGLKETSEVKKGKVQNTKSLFEHGKALGLISKVKEGYLFDKTTYSTQKALLDVIEGSPLTRRKLWKSIIWCAFKQLV